MATPVESARQRRQQTQDHAASLGIDEAYISDLVEAFYTRVQGHSELAPIFAQVIGKGGWTPHLAGMKNFWSSVALSTGRYSGQPVPKHKALAGLQEHHFAMWLGLFEATLKDTAPSPEAADYFMERANRIAHSLELAIFGMPGLPLARGQ